MLPKADPRITQSPPYVSPRDTVYLKEWKFSTTGDLNPKWKGPYHIILCTPAAVKLEGPFSWTHISRTKPVPLSQETHKQTHLLTPVNLLKISNSSSNNDEDGPYYVERFLCCPHWTQLPPPSITPIDVP